MSELKYNSSPELIKEFEKELLELIMKYMIEKKLPEAHILRELEATKLNVYATAFGVEGFSLGGK